LNMSFHARERGWRRQAERVSPTRTVWLKRPWT
jgi:hypothetical protein